jgi:hypothetical protein
MIKHEMENAFKLDVPLTVELGMGKDCRSTLGSIQWLVVVVVRTHHRFKFFDFTSQRINYWLTILNQLQKN